MPGNGTINDEPDIMLTYSARWNNLYQNVKKNWYFLAAFLILIIPLSLFVYVRFLKPVVDTTTTLLPANLSDNRIPCPAAKISCNNGKSIFANNSYIGYGMDIDKGTPLFAVFDGDLMVSEMISPKGESFWVVYLLDGKEKKEAIYWFKGVQIKARSVKKGEVIATASAQALNDFQGSKFIFTLMDPAGKAVELKPGDFK